MTFFMLFLGTLQCFLLWALAQSGNKLANNAREDINKINKMHSRDWPACALIIPVAGQNPSMAAALRSLLEQDYPNYHVYFVTAKITDPAYKLIHTFCREFSHAKLVIAGDAERCGQKNHNLLSGAAAAAPTAQILAFCDSTHIARQDFLRCLIYPLVKDNVQFSTGYHQVQPRDRKIVTLAYAICVLFMRFLQGTSSLTQLWGGAMAMTCKAFFEYNVTRVWQNNVVDDCSLSAWLLKHKIPIRLCPGALLVTWSANHSFSVWYAWLQRQILFLKFCIPGQWVILLFVSIFLILPLVWCFWALLMGMYGTIGGTAPFVALCWLCFFGWIIDRWRSFITLPVSPAPWIGAFFLANLIFAITSLSTVFKNSILWHNLRYTVGQDGIVTKIVQEDSAYGTKSSTK